MTCLENTSQQVGNVFNKRRLPFAVFRFFPLQQTVDVNISILTRKTFLLRIKTILRPGISTWRWQCPRWGCAGRSSDSGQSSCSSWCRLTFSLQTFQLILMENWSSQTFVVFLLHTPAPEDGDGGGGGGWGRLPAGGLPRVLPAPPVLAPSSHVVRNWGPTQVTISVQVQNTNLWGTAAAVGTVASAGPRWACPRGRPRCGERSPSRAWTGRRGRCSTCWCPSSWVVKYNKDHLSLLGTT